MSQAWTPAKRSVAKRFAVEVEKLCGADTATSFADAKTKLVEAELEMVRSTWLLHHSGIIRRFRWFGDVDRVQRSEIDRRLQRCFRPGQSAPYGHRSSRFAYYGRISCFRKHKR